jgi:hypothetical protein
VKTIRRLAVALAVIFASTAPTASAVPPTQVWVSGAGNDANPCTRALPCATFAAALSKVAAGGEIDCLTAGDFGNLTISKAVTIDCHVTRGKVRVAAGAMPGNFPGTYYAGIANGFPATTTLFPVGVWLQSPAVAGHSGSYANEAQAIKGEGMNIAFGLYGNGPTSGSELGWPESFGSDSGELAAAAAAGIYVVGGGDPSGNTSSVSVASVLALAASDGATGTVIGYAWADEPPCGSALHQAGNVPTEVAAVTANDSTRLTFYNEASWPAWIVSIPSYAGCLASHEAALIAPSVASYDLYPATVPYFNNRMYCGAAAHVTTSDFNTVPYDCLWLEGMGTAEAVALLAGTKPFWQFIESGSDNLAQSGQANTFTAGITSASTTLTSGPNTGGVTPLFTSAWLGLTVSGTGIPSGTKISAIVDSAHAVMSRAATATNSAVTVTVTGGVITDCAQANNLCVVNGNEYRPTPAQVNSEVWAALLNGANGILYFCHDTLSNSFCLGDAAGGTAAAVVAANLTYVDSNISTYAQQLNAPTVGICSMQNPNLTTATSCSNGILTMSTSAAAVPGMAMVKSQGVGTYLFVESDRNSASGANMTYTLTGLAGKTATVVYDSDAQYDPGNSSAGNTFLLNGSAQFVDALGANGDNYQVKIYEIQ